MVEFEEIPESPPKSEELQDEEKVSATTTPNEEVTQPEKDKNAERLTSVEVGGPSKNGAARLRALRKKRFKKSKAAAAAVVVQSSTPVDETEEQSEKSIPVPVSDPTLAPTVVEVENKDAAPSSVLPVSCGEASSVVNASSGSTDGKKWKGVAATRRKKVMEQRQQKLKEAQKSEEKAKAVINKMMPSKSNSAPYYELLILLLLFVIAFFIGGSHQENVLTYKQFHYYTPDSHSASVNHDILNVVEESEARRTLLSEFDDTEDEVHIESNIDPIFGVDLDLIISGDSLFMGLARFAVGIHRKIIYFPVKLLKNPPVFLLTSLMLRNLIRVPKVQKEAAVSNSLMSTAINFVTSSFPGLVSIYEMYKRARGDVYVMLVGFLLGAIVSKTIGGINDEL